MNKLKWDRNFALEQVSGKTELLRELLEILKKTCSFDLRLIEEGITANDVLMVCGAAHSIKGASSGLGVAGIQELASEIEDDCIAGSLQIAKMRLQELDDLIRLLVEL